MLRSEDVYGSFIFSLHAYLFAELGPRSKHCCSGEISEQNGMCSLQDFDLHRLPSGKMWTSKPVKLRNYTIETGRDASAAIQITGKGRIIIRGIVSIFNYHLNGFCDIIPRFRSQSRGWAKVKAAGHHIHKISRKIRKDQRKIRRLAHDIAISLKAPG